MAENYLPQDNPKYYTGDTVYERAKKFLEDTSRGGTDTSTKNITLDTIVTKTKEYRNSKSNIEQKRTAARELARIGIESIGKEVSLDEVKSGSYRPGVSPMNYIEGITIAYSKDGQRMELRRDKDGLVEEGRTIFTSGNIVDGVHNSQKGKNWIIDGVYIDTDGNISQGIMSPDTGSIIDGKIERKNGSTTIGTWHKDTRAFVNGTHKDNNGQKREYLNGKIVSPTTPGK